MAINQLTSANTFTQWLNATQALIGVANTLTDGNGSTFTANTILEVNGTGSRLNVRTSGAINVFFSNTGTLTNLISTNVTTSNVNVTNRIIFSDNTTLNSNVIIVRSFTQANAAFIQANTPSHVANSAADYANSAFLAANSGVSVMTAGSYANSAYATANLASNNSVVAGSYANSAYTTANTNSNNAVTIGLYANSAFSTSNTANIRSISAFVRANNSLDANNGGTVTGTVTISTGATGTSLSATANIVAPLFVGVATSARYADLAEKYLADIDYPIGTLLSIGGEKEVTASKITTRPIGVVSENPAYMMNSELEGGIYVALKGRVPIRVVGSVEKGQPLVVSNISGIAQQGTWNDNYFAISLNTSNQFEEKLIEGVII